MRLLYNTIVEGCEERHAASQRRSSSVMELKKMCRAARSLSVRIIVRQIAHVGMMELDRLAYVIPILWSGRGPLPDPTQGLSQSGDEVLQVPDLIRNRKAATDEPLERACQPSPDPDNLQPKVAIEESGKSVDIHAGVLLFSVRDEDDTHIACHVQNRQR